MAPVSTRIPAHRRRRNSESAILCHSPDHIRSSGCSGRKSPARSSSLIRYRIMSAVKHSVRFPGESAAYRKGRNELLQEEAALRSKIESVAAKRRKLALGGEPPQDYAFEEDGKKTRLSQ